MKIAVATTTINTPILLSLLRAHDSDVMFFIMGDRKTPDEKVVNFLTDIPNHAYYGIDAQHSLGYKCSRLIPENCIQRRNLAYLEALSWGADVIIAWDDDNAPIDPAYFATFDDLFSRPFNGLEVSGEQGWWDPGHLIIPKTKHRGIPHAHAHSQAPHRVSHAVDVSIGVAAGLCLGDPDIDAVTRLERAPVVEAVSEPGRAGVVLRPDNWSVVNSQNTAFRRALAPAMFLMPFVGRYDDIFASAVAQRVMRQMDLRVHYGQPFIYQQRNEHNLITDLKNEMLGMERMAHLATLLDHIEHFPSDVDPVRQVYHVLEHVAWLPKQAVDAAVAYLDDCEKVLR